MRKNRFDKDDEVHVMVRAYPQGFDRASRRAAGIRTGVHVDTMRAFYADNLVLPRAVRRLMRDPAKAVVRVNREYTRVNRVLDRYGVTL